MKSLALILASALASSSLAADPTKTVTLPLVIQDGLPSYTPRASVISAGPTATEYFIACPTTFGSLACGSEGGYKYTTIEPGTVKRHYTLLEIQSVITSTLPPYPSEGNGLVR